MEWLTTLAIPYFPSAYAPIYFTNRELCGLTLYVNLS